jgi:hypothetical protein
MRKTSKRPKYITIESKEKSTKRPLELPQEKTLNSLENNGDPKKIENPYKSSQTPSYPTLSYI